MHDTETDLARRALAVNQANLALGHETVTVDGGTFVRDTAVPRIHDANHVANITASTPAEIERLLGRVETEFAHCEHRAFHTDFTTAPAFEARLQLDGYEHSASLVMLLEGDLRGDARPFEIRQVEGEEMWDRFHALQRVGWAEYRRRVAPDEEPSGGDQMFQTYRAKCPPLRYWLAYVDGDPVGHLSSWEGNEGMGQVEDLAVLADQRHRGLATALIHHCVADARAHGAGPVVIVADASDTPKQMYAAMGFRPVAIKRSYLKMVG